MARSAGTKKRAQRKPRHPVSTAKLACDVLKHPIRVRILEVMCEGDLSPIQFLNRGMLPPSIHFDTPEAAMSHVSYHFLVLKKAGCIELVETKQRRGATEHIYRSKALAFHTDEEFAAMTFEQRRDISRSTLQMLIARADGAIIAGTFDKRRDRHLSWVPLQLDEQGWIELRDLQNESLDRAFGIKAAAIARENERREAGKEAPTVPATFGALAFESPPTSYNDAAAYEALGIAIENRRKANGLSHSALAAKAGISERELSRIENGTETRWGTLRRIASALDSELAELFSEGEQIEQQPGK